MRACVHACIRIMYVCVCCDFIFSSLFQTKLVNVTESISDKLSHFTELERIASQMSSLSVSRDNKKSLLTTLARLDECVIFIEKNVRKYSHY